MKLLRYGPQGQEKPGILDSAGGIRDLSGIVSDIGPDALAPAALQRLAELDPETLPLVAGDPRLGPCVAQVSGLGLRGRDLRCQAPCLLPRLQVKSVSSSARSVLIRSAQ